MNKVDDHPAASASEDTLKELHAAIADEFIRRVKNSTASPADLNAARQFLKDNNISCDGPRSPKLNTLADSLPDTLPEMQQ